LNHLQKLHCVVVDEMHLLLSNLDRSSNACCCYGPWDANLSH
jgi:hypothetical protein